MPLEHFLQGVSEYLGSDIDLACGGYADDGEGDVVDHGDVVVVGYLESGVGAAAVHCVHGVHGGGEGAVGDGEVAEREAHWGVVGIGAYHVDTITKRRVGYVGDVQVNADGGL